MQSNHLVKVYDISSVDFCLLRGPLYQQVFFLGTWLLDSDVSITVCRGNQQYLQEIEFGILPANTPYL